MRSPQIEGLSLQENGAPERARCDPPQFSSWHRVRLLWECRSLLFRAAALGLIIATVVAFIIPKRYQSTTQLMPPDDLSGGGLAMAAAMAGRMSGELAGIADDVLGLKSSGDLFMGILLSRTVQDDLVAKFDLRKVYRERLWQSARKRLAENTAISQDRKSGIISITVTDGDPKRAAAMAQEYVVELNAVVNQLTTSAARRERIFLEDRLKQVRQDLESAEEQLSQFSSKNGTVDIKEQGRAMVEGAASIEGQLIAAQAELQGLKQMYAENNVRVRSVRARIAELQKQLQQLGGSAEAGATTDQDRELYPSLRKLPVLGMTYADLYRNTQVEQGTFEALTQEYELAKVAEAKEVPSIKVLDPANVPEKKSFPPRLLIMLLGIFLSTGGAILWKLGQATWNEIGASDPRKLLAQEVAETVNSHMPWAPPNGSRVQAMSHRMWRHLSALRFPADEEASGPK